MLLEVGVTKHNQYIMRLHKRERKTLKFYHKVNNICGYYYEIVVSHAEKAKSQT